jgi:hypothetical protein
MLVSVVLESLRDALHMWAAWEFEVHNRGGGEVKDSERERK